jgi:hypothetical protein
MLEYLIDEREYGIDNYNIISCKSYFYINSN